jgi:hypothetical protein
MALSDLFRSFQPLHNPIGFGAADFIELFLAVMIAGAILICRPWMEPWIDRLARRTLWCMLLLFALPIALRLALLAHHPVPTPDIYDEFSHLLVADTLRHFRLANPAHPMSRFFETLFVLQQPTYSSIYPPGQGLVLAFGWTLFGTPWAGVVLSTAAFCALCYWMLRAWTTPGWALLGGMLAVMEFGPLCQWMNSYWGGAFAACGGCLIFGALPRLRDRDRVRDALLLGTGFSIHLLTRPFESVFLAVGVLAGLWLFVRRWRPALIAAAAVLPAIVLTLAQNHAVTGYWTGLPYALSQYEYGVPAALTFQTTPVPHHELTREQELDYKMQSGFHSGPETIGTYLVRLEYRIRYYRFFFLPPLYIALIAFLFRLRDRRYQWAAGCALLLALGVNFFPKFQLHYMAAATCLFVLMSVAGLEQLAKWNGEAAGILVVLCVSHFVFWYGVHVFGDNPVLRAYETWDSINHTNPERRIAIRNQLEGIPGKLLVLVRYWPQHIFQDEWVYNRAAIDESRVVWARDLGPDEDDKLTHYYPDRKVWLLEPDAAPPRLTPYVKPEPPPPPSKKEEPQKKPPLIIMEDVK